MSNAQERKLLAPNGGLPNGNWPKGELVEYVRADLFAALEAERDALVELVISSNSALIGDHLSPHEKMSVFNSTRAALAKIKETPNG